jgi:GNAT superfamily N-acetyltransferase
MQHVYGSAETGTTISLIHGPDFALITGVEVWPPFRRKGYAKHWLKKVCEDADAEQMILLLSCTPQEDDVDFDRLWAFYETLGFVEHPIGAETMQRNPRPCP